MKEKKYEQEEEEEKKWTLIQGYFALSLVEEMYSETCSSGHPLAPSVFLIWKDGTGVPSLYLPPLSPLPNFP